MNRSFTFIQNHSRRKFTPMRSVIKLDKQQEDALLQMTGLYDESGHISPLVKHKRRILRIGGYAGTGKTWLISKFYEFHKRQQNQTNPDEQQKNSANLIVAAPTNNAVNILRKDGVPARTIQSLLYHHSPLFVEGEAHDGEGEIVLTREKKPVLIKTPMGLETKLKNSNFEGLLILDESSMIGRKMFEDIKNFAKKIIFIGDPFQLPPVKDEDIFGKVEPDALLLNVHRIGESPALAYAMAIRKNETLDYTQYNIKDYYDEDEIEEIFQNIVNEKSVFICWTNYWRQRINDLVRKLRGYKGWQPVQGEKVVFCENFYYPVGPREYDYVGIYNGLRGVVQEFVEERQLESVVKIRCEDGVERKIPVQNAPLQGGHPGRAKNLKAHKIAPPVHVEYGYALTCHKAQGSQWENVYVLDQIHAMENKLSNDESRRWLYTAVTRTTNNLSMVLPGIFEDY